MTKEQDRFERMAQVLYADTKGYELWPVCLINLLYAYETWKDGAEWDHVVHIMNDPHPYRESLIHRLQSIFGYPKEK